MRRQWEPVIVAITHPHTHTHTHTHTPPPQVEKYKQERVCRTSLRSNVRAGARGDLLDAAGVVFTSDLTTPASLTTTTEADPPAFVLLSAAMSGKQRTAAYSDACFSRSSREDMPGAGGFFSCDAIHDSIFSRRFREPCDSTRGGALQQRLAIEAPSGRYGQWSSDDGGETHSR